MTKSISQDPSLRLRATHRGEKVKKAVSIVGVAALAFIGVTEGIKQSKERTDYSRDQIQAQTDSHQVDNSVIVLESGARYRLTPNFSSDANNIAGKVPQGKELVVQRSQISGDPTVNTLNQSGATGFLKPGIDPSTIKTKVQRAEDTVWVDLSGLEAQHLAREYSAGVGPLVNDAQVGADGQILIGGRVDPHAGMSNMKPAGVFQQASNGQ